MQFHFDNEANTLYIALHEGPVAQTIEITDMVYVDADASGTPLGIEFVSADEFVPFLRRLQELDAAGAWPVYLPAEIHHLFSVRGVIRDMDGTEPGLPANVDGEEDDIAYEPDADRVRQILDETAGGWADVDVDAMIAAVYEARRAGSRPPDRP